VVVKLLGLQYRLVYKKGAENSAGDALSRRVHSDSHILAVSSATPVLGLRKLLTVMSRMRKPLNLWLNCQ
jgi:hypothetical protein